MDADADLYRCAAIAGDSEQAIDEIAGRGRNGLRIPAQLVRRRRLFVEAIMEGAVFEQRERRMHRRRPDAVQPAAAIAVAWRGERGPGQLLGIQPMRDTLRRVASLRQGARQRLGGELVAETRLVGKRHAESSVTQLLPSPTGRGAGGEGPAL